MEIWCAKCTYLINCSQLSTSLSSHNTAQSLHGNQERHSSHKQYYITNTTLRSTETIWS